MPSHCLFVLCQHIVIDNDAFIDSAYSYYLLGHVKPRPSATPTKNAGACSGSITLIWMGKKSWGWLQTTLITCFMAISMWVSLKPLYPFKQNQTVSSDDECLPAQPSEGLYKAPQCFWSQLYSFNSIAATKTRYP